jgi:hypothetical protein
MKKPLIGLAVLCAAVGTQADLLLSERFDYPDGSLTNVSGGKWTLHSGNRAGLFVRNGAVELDSLTSVLTDDVNAALAGGPFQPGGGASLYARFSVKLVALPTGAGNYFAHFRDAGTGYRCRVFATTSGAAAGKYRLGIANSGSSCVTFPVDLSLHTARLAVMRYEIGAGVSTLWVEPAAETDLSVIAQDEALPIGVVSFALRQSWSSGAGAGKVVLDDLFVATSFAEVMAATGPPIITRQPVSQSVLAGSDVSFSVSAFGAAPLSYQWEFNQEPMAGVTGPSLSLSKVDDTRAGKYRVVISNAVGSATSQEAELSVTATVEPPSIVKQPVSQTVPEGADATFLVEATGTDPLSYQWRHSGTNLPGGTNATLTLIRVTLAEGGEYRVNVGNAAGRAISDVAVLTVQPAPAPALTNIAYLHTLLDPATYAPTDTTSLFTVEGIVTTHANLTSGANALFYAQDDTGGIAVFWRGGGSRVPHAGDRVRVTAPLTHYNGLLELSPDISNLEHKVSVVSSNNPLPLPTPLDLSGFSWPDPAMVEPLEGSYIALSNVFLDLSSLTFPSGKTVNLADGSGNTFVLFSSAYTDLPGQVKPTAAVTLLGVLGQYDASSPYTEGYQIIPSRFADVLAVAKAPAIRWTNVLANLVRPGDALTNTYDEHGLRPGEQLTMTVWVNDPEGRIVTVRPVTEDLPPSASWEFTSTTGAEVSGTFAIRPTVAASGRHYTVSLLAWNDVATNTAIWSVYVPTRAEQQVAITEFLANPTGNAEAPHYNPLRRETPAVQNPILWDEYVELANLSDTDLNLEGWTMADAVKVRHIFRGAMMLLSSNAVVVYGGPLNEFPPGLDVPAEPASEGTACLALNNSGSETILVRNASGNLVARVFYNGADLSNEGSLTRYPDINGPFVPQTSVSTNHISPGRQFDGRLFSEPVFPTRIGSLTATLAANGAVVLTWAADGGRTYTIWSAENVAGPYTVLSTGLTTGHYSLQGLSAFKARFYRLSSP